MPTGSCSTVSPVNAMKLPHRRHFLHLATGAAALPVVTHQITRQYQMGLQKGRPAAAFFHFQRSGRRKSRRLL